jgi:hypothetical protein
MSMHYITNGKRYSISYKELKYHYNSLVSMDDQTFMENIPTALHIACIISFFKELSNDCTLGDEGIVHQLVHILTGDLGPTRLSDVREQFQILLKLD